MTRTISIPPTADTKSMGVVAKYLMHGPDGLDLAQREGASQRVQNILKGAVAAGATDGWGSALADDTRIAQDGFIEGVRNSSVFLRLLNAGIKQIPLRQQLSIVTTNATGYVRGEGSAKPVSSLALENAGIDVLEAVCLVIVSDELLKVAQPEAQALLDRELKAGVAEAIDRQFVSILTAAAATSTASVGFTASAAAYDLRTMLDDVSTNAGSRLHWLCSVSVAKRASALYDSGAFLFPQMTPQGGTMLGLPALVSDQLTNGRLLLVDATGIVGNTDGTQLEIFSHANVAMESSPDSPDTTSTVEVNLWSRNLKALFARSYFGASVFRDNAVIQKTGILWGNAADSPA